MVLSPSAPGIKVPVGSPNLTDRKQAWVEWVVR